MQASSTGNAIIDLLLQSSGSADLPLVLERAECASVEAGTELQRSGAPIEFAWFPLSGMAALVWALEDGSEVTTIGIGADDAIHATPQLELDRCAYHVRTFLPSEMLKIPAVVWQRFLEVHPSARLLLNRHGQCLLARTQQALACIAKHDVESRLCGWLLDFHEWQNGQPFPITHQTLSTLLGVRRTTITLMARSLQDAGIIAYRRGLIAVTDLHALRQASCECHNFRRACHHRLQGVLATKSIEHYAAG